MRKITQAISAVCLLFALNSSAVALASSPSPLNHSNVARLAEQAPIHWVSVAQIENSLAGRPPMAVGFDIDDTVLFPVRASGAAKNLLARKRRLSEKSCVLGKNEQWLG